MRDSSDCAAIRNVVLRLGNHVEGNDLCQEVNLIDVIASLCGWKPLVFGEKMKVSFGAKVYEITRTE